MSVMERQREFGIMMALGMMPGQVVRLVLLESCDPPDGSA
jgi:ABC-type antimicrobial peptide transport system permease subunit